MIDGKLESQERHPNDVQAIIESSGAMALYRLVQSRDL